MILARIKETLHTTILQIRYERTDRRELFKGMMPTSIITTIPALNSSEASIRRATNCLEHKFDLLGSGNVKLDYCLTPEGVEGCRYMMSLDLSGFDRSGAWLKKILRGPHEKMGKAIWSRIEDRYEPIDWQQDFKSGYRWSQKSFHKRISPIPNLEGVDIKIPWELARFQHLPHLAVVAGTAQDVPLREKLIEEFKNEVLDFMAANPVGMGVNWVCAMDIAIRAVNLLVARDFMIRFDTTHILSGDFNRLFNVFLYRHGEFIRENLERSALNANHYLADIAGLFIIALYFDHEPWRAFAGEELQREIQKQFYEDGTNFEASTCYHRLSTELIFYPVLFAVRKDKEFNGENYPAIGEKLFGKPYLDKLYAIFDSFIYLLKPNGRAPQIGDNDSGQFFKLYPRDELDMRYILSLGAVFFKEERWKLREFFSETDDIAELKILMGEAGQRTWETLHWSELSQVRSRSFEKSGWHILRNNKNYIIIQCGANENSNFGAHAHNDQLSFELMLHGKDVIVDPGTYVYTPLPAQRDLFRSVASHNTVVFSRAGGSIIEQNDFADAFSMIPRTRAEALLFDQNSFSGKIVHDLFECRRDFELSENGVVIENTVYASEGITWYNNMIFALDADYQHALINNKPVSEYRLEDAYLSSGYGQKARTRRLTIESSRIDIAVGGSA